MNYPEIDFISARNILFRNSEAGLAAYKYMYGSNDDLKARNEADWFPFRSSRMNTDNVLDTIEARKTPGEFNVIRNFPDGKIEFSRFSNGNLKWNLEQKTSSDGDCDKYFASEHGLNIHNHSPYRTIKVSIPNNADHGRITIIDTETNKIINQEMVEKDMITEKYSRALEESLRCRRQKEYDDFLKDCEEARKRSIQEKRKAMEESRANSTNTNTDRTSAFEKGPIKAPDRSGAINNNASTIQKTRENIKADTNGIVNSPNKTGIMESVTPIQTVLIKTPDMSAAMNTNMNAGMGGAMNAGMSINPMQMQQFGGR